jgi:hypothetical protein
VVGNAFIGFTPVFRLVNFAFPTFASLSMPRPVTISPILAHSFAHTEQTHPFILPFLSIGRKGVECGWLLEQIM